MAVNVASRRAMEKAGLILARAFYPDWLLSIAGGADGGVEYAVSKADWVADPNQG